MSDRKVKGFDVTVRGQYHAASGKDRIVRVFGPVTFFIPEMIEIPNGKKREKKTIDGREVFQVIPQFKMVPASTENVALWVVQRKLLPSYLASKHPDCVRMRTCSIVPGGLREVTKDSTQQVALLKPVAQMTLQELRVFCQQKNLPVAVEAFSKVEDARDAVLFEMEMLSGPQAIPSEPAQAHPIQTVQDDEDLLG